MKLRIKVTKEVLDKSKMCGTVGRSTNCAISLAVRDVFPNAVVGCDRFYPEVTLDNNFLWLPFIARDFIVEFDSSSPEERVKMKPIEFEVDVPESVINTIDITEITKLLQDHPTLELVCL